MQYPDHMKDLIKKVESTRLARIEETRAGKHFPKLSSAGREDILKKYHPDFIEGAKRALRIGKDKGSIVPNEVADLLEAEPLLDPKNIELKNIHYDTDVLIIGGGGAGSAAALAAQDQGAKVLVVTKLRHGDANTMMAEGGIQAADKSDDSPGFHYLDTLGGGHFDNDPDLVKALVMEAPSAVKWLEGLGVMFDKDPDGAMKTLLGAGTSRKRMHSAGDMTGAEIMRTLRDEVRNRSGNIKVIEFSPAIELVLDDKGQCAGAVFLNLETGAHLLVKAKTVIIATGGFGRLHLQGFPTTNHYGATADGLVLCYRAGCSLKFMDASQFHPTGVIFPEQNVGLLITEKVRGAGAQVVNIDGEQFVYPLEPRDVESSAIIRECLERKKGVNTPTGRLGVWLDSPMIETLKGEGSVKSLFPAKYRQFMRHGIDISKEPMLIYPTLHYQNGGVKIDEYGRTEISNLYVAGEASGGVHGRNRLMGNSLLDIIVFGRRSGYSAASKSKEVRIGKPTLQHVIDYMEALKKFGIKSGATSPMLLPDYAGKIG
ncbi:MAG: FAD-binding protein [Candidatus Omnitrophota bacterium]|nr:FAD-binding protein [Candidatus Omnitrophota bacterium]